MGRLLVILAVLWAVPGVEADIEPAGHFRRAHMLQAQGDLDGAIETYEAFLLDHAGHCLAPVAAMAVANLQLLGHEDPRTAARDFRRVIANYPESGWAAEAARRLGECLEAQGAWMPAGEAYAEALALSGHEGTPTHPEWTRDLLLATARCHEARGEEDKLIDTYELLLEAPLPPATAAEILQHLGDTYAERGAGENASHCYAQIIQQYPLLPAFNHAWSKRDLINQHLSIDWAPYEMFLRANHALRLGDLVGAASAIDSLLAGSPEPALRGSARYRRILAQTSIDADFARGARDLQAHLAAAPDRRLYPNADWLLDHFRQTARLASRVEEHPDDVSALCALGLRYLISRLPQRAIELLEQARERDPDDGEVQMYLGYAYRAVGNPDASHQAFLACLKEDPDNVSALHPVGHHYLAVGEGEKAIECFARFAAVYPEDPSAHFSLAEAYRQTGRTEEAAASWRQFLALEPEGERAEQARAALAELEEEK